MNTGQSQPGLSDLLPQGQLLCLYKIGSPHFLGSLGRGGLRAKGKVGCVTLIKHPL